MGDFDFEDALLYGGRNKRLKLPVPEYEASSCESGGRQLIQLSASDIDKASEAPSRYLDDEEDVAPYCGPSHELWDEEGDETEAEDDQEIYVLVCGTSSRGNLEDFRESAARVSSQTVAPTAPNLMNSYSVSKTDSVAVVEANVSPVIPHFGTLVPSNTQCPILRNEAAGRSEKVTGGGENYKAPNHAILMEWQLHNERPWVRVADSSAWFNYGFNETNFREWLQQQIRLRHERLRDHLQTAASRCDSSKS